MDVLEFQYFNAKFDELHQHIDASMNRIMQGESQACIEEIPTPESLKVDPPVLKEEAPVPAPAPAPVKRGRKPAAGQTPFPVLPPISVPATPSAALAPREIDDIPFTMLSDLVVKEEDGSHRLLCDLSDRTLSGVEPKFIEMSDKIGHDVALGLIKKHTGASSLKEVTPDQYTKLFYVFEKAYDKAIKANPPEVPPLMDAPDDLSDQTLAQVAPLFVEISNKIGRDVALALIKEHTGAASLKDVKPEQYTKLYHLFKKAYHNACQADLLPF